MIENKIANSGLITLDLEKLIPADIIIMDLKDYLFRGLILREKDFREAMKNTDWKLFAHHHIGIHCSADAIIPLWAYMLVTSYLQPIAKSVTVGNLIDVQQTLLLKAIDAIQEDEYKNEKLIIKGCSDVQLPAIAYAAITTKLLPVVKSLMYGEPCSTVPVYKRKD